MAILVNGLSLIALSSIIAYYGTRFCFEHRQMSLIEFWNRIIVCLGFLCQLIKHLIYLASKTPYMDPHDKEWLDIMGYGLGLLAHTVFLFYIFFVFFPLLSAKKKFCILSPCALVLALREMLAVLNNLDTAMDRSVRLIKYATHVMLLGLLAAFWIVIYAKKGSDELRQHRRRILTYLACTLAGLIIYITFKTWKAVEGNKGYSESLASVSFVCADIVPMLGAYVTVGSGSGSSVLLHLNAEEQP